MMSETSSLSSTALPNTEDDGTYDYEQTHVHDVYNQIASHFSETRYKPWPVVDNFLKRLRPGAVGLDVGCGNGKYLQVRDDVYIVASDRSSELVKIASQHQPHSTVVADTLSLPHPAGVFDFAICIAVVHHLSTRERRIEAVRHILERLRAPGSTISKEKDNDIEKSTMHGCDTEGGEALFFVWALEQKNSRRGWDEGHEQDVLVPWVLKPHHDRNKIKPTGTTPIESNPIPTTDEATNGRESEQSNTAATTYQRYYHLYRRSELEEDVVTAGGEVVRNGYDRDNWWCVARRKPEV